jgi:hypothetical protein
MSSYHHKGACITCNDPIEFLSARPYERECVNCQYFKRRVKSLENPLSKSSEFWDEFPEGPRGCVWFETDRKGKTTRNVDRSRFDPFAKKFSADVWRNFVVRKNAVGEIVMTARILRLNPEGLGEWLEIPL